MWGFGRREDQVSSAGGHYQSSSNHLMPPRESKKNGKKGSGGAKTNKPPHRGRGKGGRQPANDASLNMDEMNVNETKHGIEVSLDAIKRKEMMEMKAALGNQTNRPPVILIKEQIRKREKLYQAQFSVSFPMIQHQQGKGLPTAASAPISARPGSDENWIPKDHRIPLLGYSQPDMSYEDVWSKLQNHQVIDEYTAVQTEIKHMKAEIDAVGRDRGRLESNLKKSPGGLPAVPSNKSMPFEAEWDVCRVLRSAPPSLPTEDQLELQRVRGTCLTVHMQNPRARDAFLTKCGSKNSHVVQKSRSNSKRRSLLDTVTLSPGNCRSGGAGTSIQHISIMYNGTSSASSFFLSRDAGKSMIWGRLPPRLFRRMQESETSSNRGDTGGELLYLSTGPRGGYYAEFRSGECWWGNSGEDDDFHYLIQTWDVYRVVFGPVVTLEDQYGTKIVTNSWIILSRDGRAAWKNLPSRLHHCLESRLASWSAPAEIALGPGDSYYIRFLDGTVDYCLPAMIADVCEHIERNGGFITDISLNPEISHDFVIRHTEMR